MSPVYDDVLSSRAYEPSVGFNDEGFDGSDGYTSVLFELCIIACACWIMASLYTRISEIAFRYDACDCLVLPDTSFTRVFFGTTFLAAVLQALGTALASSVGYQTVKFGKMVVLSGRITESIVISAFFATLAIFLYRMRMRHFTSFGEAHRQLSFLTIASTCMLIRSCMRIVQTAQGPDGVFNTNEIWFWLLDALPLLVGSVVTLIVPRGYPQWTGLAPRAQPGSLKAK